MFDEHGDKVFDLETPIGKVRTRGYRIGDIANVFLLVVLCLILYLLWEHRAEGRLDTERLAKAVDRQTETQIEMNYILSLSQEDRAKLNIIMPSSLRNRTELRR